MKINLSIKGPEHKAESILILHGWGSSARSWTKTQNYLAGHGYKVIIPDFPGFGESDPPPKPWNGEDYLNWLLEFIKRESIETPVTIIGHSFGGGLSMKLAIDHPHLIKNLVLVAAARTGSKKSLRKEIIYKIARFGKYIIHMPILFNIARKLFYKFVVRSRDYYRAKGVMKDTIKLILKEDVTPIIHKIKTPTLIIWGTRDKATPIENAYVIHEKIENSTLEVIQNCGHAISLEQPEKLADLVEKFLKKS